MPLRRRKQKREEAEARVYPPSRWRALREYRGGVSPLDDLPVIPGALVVETYPSKREAKRLAYPRRVNRWGRQHGRQATTAKGWRW